MFISSSLGLQQLILLVIDRIELPPLIPTPHSNPRIATTQKDLQQATEELEGAISAYAKKFSNYPPLKDEDIAQAVSSSKSNESGFGKLIEQVLSDQEIKGNKMAGKVGSFMGKIYPVASFALGIISFGADAAGFLPLKITANGLNAVVTLAAKQRGQSDDILKSLTDLEDNEPFLSSLKEIGYERLGDEVLEAATKLLTAILTYLRVSLVSLQRDFILDVAKGIASDDIGDAQKALDTAAKRLDRAVQHEIFLDGERKKWTLECDQAMGSLSSLKYWESHDNVRNRRLEHIGKWILEDRTFLDWMDEGVKALWCYGRPGAGKTFISSVVIDYVLSTYTRTDLAVGIAYLYCNYNDQKVQTIDMLIASIAKQLVASMPSSKQKALMEMVIKFSNTQITRAPGLP